MKALFLTSGLGGMSKTPEGIKIIGSDNTNHFVDRLKLVAPTINKFVFIVSNPDNYFRYVVYASNVTKSLNIDGFDIQETVLIDHEFKGNIKETILSSDVVFLSGGNTSLQNMYFKEINLKEILQNYNGVIIGQSAGSMNCATTVYAQPENYAEFTDANFQKTFSGLGLTDINVMPHMNRAKTDAIEGVTTYDMCISDSFTTPHYGISDGGFIEIKNGKATAYGETLLFNQGVCTKLCEKGQSVLVEPIAKTPTL